MSQPPATHYPRQPQARPPRPRRKRLRRRTVVLLALGAILFIAVIANASGRSGKPTNQGSSAASTAARAASLADSEKSAAHACGKRRPASRDIYVRIIKPGTSPAARKLGGRWRWDHVTGQCLTAVRFMTATAPRSAGHCTQVGYVTDNPGYDPNATPAPFLPHTAAQAGPACAAAAAAAAPTTPAPAAPTETSPTAVAPPPAPTTPAGCYPLSDEGTCYQPGEYCRDDDHGASGVAGDGEAISCEYNDGWRWEPA